MNRSVESENQSKIVPRLRTTTEAEAVDGLASAGAAHGVDVGVRKVIEANKAVVDDVVEGRGALVGRADDLVGGDADGVDDVAVGAAVVGGWGGGGEEEGGEGEEAEEEEGDEFGWMHVFGWCLFGFVFWVFGSEIFMTRFEVCEV